MPPKLVRLRPFREGDEARGTLRQASAAKAAEARWTCYHDPPLRRCPGAFPKQGEGRVIFTVQRYHVDAGFSVNRQTGRAAIAICLLLARRQARVGDIIVVISKAGSATLADSSSRGLQQPGGVRLVLAVLEVGAITHPLSFFGRRGPRGLAGRIYTAKVAPESQKAAKDLEGLSSTPSESSELSKT